MFVELSDNFKNMTDIKLIEMFLLKVRIVSISLIIQLDYHAQSRAHAHILHVYYITDHHLNF